MTKVSIIIPIYNAGKTLYRCLQAIINQTFKNFKVICINDGSTDNSLNILKKFTQKDSFLQNFFSITNIKEHKVIKFLGFKIKIKKRNEAYKNAKVYDCFTFFNENDLLEIRLNVLKDVVDKFIIVEATKTHSGFDKPLNFDKERFKKFEDKIIYVALDEYPEFKTSWTYENYQRNYISNILKYNCNDEDVIIISDLDEIINPKAIQNYKKNGEGISSLRQKFYYYYLNMQNTTTPYWNFPKIFRYKELFNEKNNFQNIYSEYLLQELNQNLTPTKIRLSQPQNIIKNGGWHFSYLGGVDKIIEKLKSFSHQEFNIDDITNKENLLKRIANKEDILNRGFLYDFVNIDLSFPKYIRNNKKQFKEYIFPVSFNNILKKYIINIFNIYNSSDKRHKIIKIFGVNLKFKI